MTREQIKKLTSDGRSGNGQAVSPLRRDADAAFEGSAAPAPDVQPEPVISKPPVLAPEIKVYYLPASGAGQGLEYRPAAAGWMEVFYSSSGHNLSVAEKLALAAPLAEGPTALDWSAAREIALDAADMESDPLPGAGFAGLPASAAHVKNYSKWSKDLLRWVRQNRPLVIYQSRRFGVTGLPGESRSEFMVRLAQAAREKRDLEVEKLRRKYSSRFNTLNNRLMRAEQAVMREKEQSQSRKVQTAISFGTAILGAFLGRKAASAGSASRFGSAMRSADRIRKESMDVKRAQETLEATRQELENLDRQLQEDIERTEAAFDPESEVIREVSVKPKSSDLTLNFFGLVWLPFRRDARGQFAPDWT
jgi:hypothetical protein